MNRLPSIVPTKTLIPVCKLCNRRGGGPVEASKDGSGYIHSYGCKGGR